MGGSASPRARGGVQAGERAVGGRGVGRADQRGRVSVPGAAERGQSHAPVPSSLDFCAGAGLVMAQSALDCVGANCCADCLRSTLLMYKAIGTLMFFACDRILYCFSKVVDAHAHVSPTHQREYADECRAGFLPK